MSRRHGLCFDRKRIIREPTMIQLQVIFQFSLSMQIGNTHITWQRHLLIKSDV